MQFIKVKIFSPKDSQSVDSFAETLLLNINHVVSIKPIRMILEDNVIDGYWIRTTNGKKYRALEIPEELKAMIKSDSFGLLSSEETIVTQPKLKKGKKAVELSSQFLN